MFAISVIARRVPNWVGAVTPDISSWLLSIAKHGIIVAISFTKSLPQRHAAPLPMNKFPILMYHRVVSERCPVPGNDPDESRYGVPLEQFERQLDRMEELGLTGVSVRRVHERLETGEPVPSDWVVVTFDDGNASDLIHAAPLLAAHGYDATFYVCGCSVG
jgi:hypothetical protein